MIEDAEEKGLIKPGVTTLVETTSGNLGIGLAYISIGKGYKFTAVMFDNYALDKRMLLQYLGAEVSLTGEKEALYFFSLYCVCSCCSHVIYF